ALGDVPADATPEERLGAVRRLLLGGIPSIMPYAVPIGVAGFGAYVAGTRLLGNLATPVELETVRRALPHNPTTEMDLALWALARSARSDPAAARCLSAESQQHPAAAYRAGTLPEPLQQGLTSFL